MRLMGESPMTMTPYLEPPPAYIAPDGFERWPDGKLVDSWRNCRIQLILDEALTPELGRQEADKYIAWHDGVAE